MSAEHKNQPPPLTIEAVAQDAVEQMRREGSHSPTLIIEGSRATAKRQGIKFSPMRDERRIQMVTLGLTVAQEESIGVLRQVFLISEGWLTSIPIGDPPQNQSSEVSKRIEVLQITGYQPTSRATDAAVFEMIRDGEGKLIELKRHEPHQVVVSPLLVAFTEGYQRGRLGM